MGRFISPDTIVPNPANPQSFNRYSYCLNNPLKYTDPSGRIVTIEGINVSSINTYMQYYSGYFGASVIFQSAGSMGLYWGYAYFRSEHHDQATQLEQMKDTVNIRYGDTDAYRSNGMMKNPDSIMHKADGEYNIILNNTIDNNISSANNFYQAGAILNASYYITPVSFFPDLSDFPTSDQAIIAYDIAAITGDVVSIVGFANPVTNVGGQLTSAAASVNGFLETWYRFKTGRSDWLDLTVSGFTTTTGFIPYFGIIPEMGQLLWDTNR
jgi:hypothetical protein